MATQANITVFDGAATPVSHTLVGEDILREPNGSTAVWREQLATVPSMAQVRYTQIKRKLKSGVTQTVARIEVPVMESVSGVNSAGYTAPPKVAYVDRYEIVGFAHDRSTETTRRIAMQMLLNIDNNVSVTTPAVSAGISADLHQRGQQVT
jgi:hypothetical protein